MTEEWQRLRRAWLAELRIDEKATGGIVEELAGGWTRGVIGLRAGTGRAVSRFAIHEESGFVYEQRTIEGMRTYRITSPDPIPDPGRVQDARWHLLGDPRGRHPKMPPPGQYVADFAYLRAQLGGREPTRRMMAHRYRVTPDTEGRYRKRWLIPWPPDMFDWRRSPDPTK